MHDRFPFVLRWKGKQTGPTANRDVVFYRKALDSLKPCDVSFFHFSNMFFSFMHLLQVKEMSCNWDGWRVGGVASLQKYG